MAIAADHAGPFAFVRTRAVSVPVITGDLAAYGYDQACSGVFTSGLAALEGEEGGSDVVEWLAMAIAAAQDSGTRSIILGCVGMSHLKPALAARAGMRLIDGVVLLPILPGTCFKSQLDLRRGEVPIYASALMAWQLGLVFRPFDRGQIAGQQPF
jgi:Asp/Glu/hydantoin racemase